jgi:hypothetical protein
MAAGILLKRDSGDRRTQRWDRVLLSELGNPCLVAQWASAAGAGYLPRKADDDCLQELRWI